MSAAVQMSKERWQSIRESVEEAKRAVDAQVKLARDAAWMARQQDAEANSDQSRRRRNDSGSSTPKSS